ncbi:MAG: glycosyltransferase [Nitrospirota bacterium]|nr:glycosyltransferase [Nitrospirota bacterium]
MPKVSVIIPTFNRLAFLQAAVESVLKQTFQDFEIIVVDDASNEDVQGIVQGFNDKRIKCIRHEVNKGEAGSRNTGILHATGEFIAFLDDDDTWVPDKLRLQMNVLENSPLKVGGIYSGFIAADCAGKKLQTKIPTKKGDIYRDLLVKNTIGTPSTVLIRRTCVETAGLFDEDICYGTDHDFYLRISRHFDFEFIAAPLVRYHIHDSRISNNPEMMAKGLKAMAHKYRDEVGKLRHLRQRQIGLGYLSAGVQFCYKGELTKGIRAFIASIRLYPFEPRAYFNLLISLLGKNNFIKIKKIKDLLLDPLRSRGTILP